MKKNILLVILLLAGTLQMGHSQSILFVDDSDDTFGNAERISAALEAKGFVFDSFNANEEQFTPSVETLSTYDIIIWETSTDEADMMLWNGNDTDNEEIKGYLDQGGIMWLMGNDFLFDRYEVGTTYTDGDFLYDYCGITEYSAQTYNDDGEIGVPRMDPAADSPISGLQDLNWIFSTLWYADVVEKRAEADVVYELSANGENPDYVFDGRTGGVLHETDNFIVLTYFFDLALCDTDALVENNVETVMDYLQSKVVSNTQQTEFVKLEISPNPVVGDLRINLNSNTVFEYSIFDQIGNVVSSAKYQELSTINVQQLISGVYHIKIVQDNKFYTAKFVKI